MEKNGLCKTDEIAKLFGVTVRRVQQLTQDGVIATVKTSRGGTRYELEDTVSRYIKYLSDKAYGREQTAGEKELKNQKLEAEIALKQSQSELSRLKTDIAAGKYISIEAVQLDYAKFFAVFKKFATSIPARISGQLASYTDPVIVRSLETELTKEINSMLKTFIVAAEVSEV